VKILAVMLDSHPILGFWLASTQLFASALGEFFSARPGLASVGRYLQALGKNKSKIRWSTV
jgi:hypothetical protein